MRRRSLRSSLSSLSSLPLLVLTVGCYTYVSTATVAPPAAGAELRATLTDAGSIDVASQVGPGVVTIDGRLISESTAAPLVLAATETTARSGIATTWRGERLTIPRADIATLQVRTFSRQRSVLASGVLVASLAFLIHLVSGTTGGSGVGGPPPVVQ